MTKTPLILASSSPSRLELLASIDIVPDKVISPDVDEAQLKKELPRNYCQRVAKAKFDKAVEMLSLKDAVIIVADTITVCGTRILHKSYDPKELRAHLELLSGRRHRGYTCVYVGLITDGKVEKFITKTVMSVVSIKRLQPQEIDFLLQSGQCEGKAGGCKISGVLGRFIKFVSGSWSNIIGLPLYELSQMLYNLGYIKYNKE